VPEITSESQTNSNQQVVEPVALQLASLTPQQTKSQPQPNQNPPVSSSAVTQPSVEYAGFWVRSAAFFIDGIVLGLPLLITAAVLSFIMNQGAVITKENQDFSTTGAGVLLIPIFIYFVTRYGATPGKMFFSLKIVKEDGDIPDLKTAFMREAVGKIVSAIPLNLGYYWVAFDKEKRGIHDIIAKTHVVLTQPLSSGRKIVVYVFAIVAFVLSLIAIIALVYVVLRVLPLYRQVGGGTTIY